MLGEEEFKHACEKSQKEIDDKVQQKLVKAEQELKTQFEQEKREIDEKNSLERQKESDRVRVEERTKLALKHSQELAEKDKQIELAKLQVDRIVEEKITQAIVYNEDKHKQREKEFELQRTRMQNDNRELMERAEKLQKTLDNIPVELRGTASEFVLLDELTEEFPDDEITPKTVGKAMADVVQVVVTETGERISTPIVYDRKTGESIKPSDIEKAKNYKRIHKTDYCLIVADKGIKNNRLTEEREGILLVHRTIVLDIAKRIRHFLIETSRQARTNEGRNSKQEKLYEYFTSLEYTRDVQEKLETRSKLDDLQRREEKYHKDTWSKRKDLVERWSDLDRKDARRTKDITEEDPEDSHEDPEDSDKEEI
jgi:hypothetical protein